jgi:hypothetical protein
LCKHLLLEAERAVTVTKTQAVESVERRAFKLHPPDSTVTIILLVVLYFFHTNTSLVCYILCSNYKSLLLLERQPTNAPPARSHCQKKSVRRAPGRVPAENKIGVKKWTLYDMSAEQLVLAVKANIKA